MNEHLAGAMALPIAMVAVAASYLTLLFAAPWVAERVDAPYAVAMLILTIANLTREAHR